MLWDFRQEEFDIVIQAGQSNSYGVGLGPATEPFVQNASILYFNDDFTICRAHEEVFGNEIVGNFSLAFSTKYVKSGKLSPGRKLLIIRSAVGGTGFLDKRWGLTDDLYLRMIEMTKTALKLNPANRLVALLWHQGETDALLQADRNTHVSNLSMLIDSVRKTYGREDLPFVAADFVNQWKMANIDICLPVVTAIEDVCASVGYARFVATDNLQSNDQRIGNNDTIHFCRESINQLGIAYYDAFSEITK